MLVMTALRDDRPMPVQDRRGPEQVAVGRRQAVSNARRIEQHQREPRNVTLMTAEMFVALREALDRAEPLRALVAEPLRHGPVSLSEIDDDPIAQRALAYDQLIAPEQRGAPRSARRCRPR